MTQSIRNSLLATYLLLLTSTLTQAQTYVGCDINAIRNAFTSAGCIDITGPNIGCSMYFFTPNSMTGDQAQAYAETFGANLVSIQNAAENQQVVDGLNNNGLSGVIWIGFNDQAQENAFVWYDQNQITYTNWASGEPNNVTPSCCTAPIFGCSGSQCNGEDCTQMYANGQWNDLPCGGTNNGSVIEVNLCPQITTSPDATICIGSAVNLTATTILGSLPYTYSWTGGSSGTTLTVTPSTTTTYSVTVTDRYGCESSNDIWVDVYEVNADAGPDVSICGNGSTQLNATGGDRYIWSPTTGLDDPMIPNPVANPATTTDYVVEVLEVQGNQVVNGDFSAGNQAFTSNYGYNPNDLRPEGVYAVTSNPNAQHSGFSGVDHTTGSGNLLAVNGSGSPNQNVWCQTAPVNPGTDYEFSTWVSSLAAGSPAQLQFSINGVTIGNIFTAPAGTGVWQQFFATWNSGGATSATICIVNQNTATGGNDFGLDDINFSEVCSGYDTVRVTIFPPAPANAGADTAICVGESTELNATGGVSYSWTPTTALNNPAIANPIASPTATTTYTVTVTDSNGCIGVDSMLLTVYPLPQVSFNGLDPAYCEDAPDAQLTGVPTGGNFNGPGISGQTFSPANANMGAQIVSYTYTDVNGCTDSLLRSVTVNPLPILDIQGLDTDYCLDDAQVTVNPDPSGGLLTGNGISGFNFNPSVAGVGTHTLTYSYMDQNGCDDTITTEVEVLELPVSTIEPIPAICYGYADGEATVSPTAGQGHTYEWNTVPSQSTATATGLPAGNYTVTVTDDNGCTFVESTTVTEPIQLQVDVLADRDSLFLGETALLSTVDNSNDSVTYEWSPAEFLDCTTCPMPNALPVGEGLSEHEFTVTITDSAGCMATNTIVLVIKLPKVYYTPDAFTPNGDGLNDVFEIFTEGTKQFNFQVFDRWGTMVYQTNDPDFIWDGTYKGKQLDPGVYVYRLTLAYLDNVFLKDAGSITIIR